MKPGFAAFWDNVVRPEVQTVIFLFTSVKTLMMLSFHDGHITSRAFAAVSKALHQFAFCTQGQRGGAH